MTDLVKELRAGLDGVTPGPWEARLNERDGEVRDCFVQAPDVNGFAYKAEILGDDEYREQSGGMKRRLADVLHIARCSPENIAALLDHIEAISSENERLKAALTKAKAFHDRDSGCNGFTADYEILRLEIDEALALSGGSRDG